MTLSNKKPWTERENQYLTNCYLNGIPVLVIARNLNRTPSSVSKRIDRSGITRNRKVANRNRAFPMVLTEPFFVDEDKSVSVKKMLRLLEQDNIRIFPCPQTKTYRILGRKESFTPGQLLILFNKQRLNKGLPVLYVQGITDV